jgi:transmembrane sensor
MTILRPEDLEKIERYINGLAEDSERKWVESLFLKGEENYSLRNMLEKDWNLISADSSSSSIDLSNLLDRIHHTIRKNENQKKRSFLRRFSRVYMKVAAILILPLLIAGAIVYKQFRDHSISIFDKPVISTIYAPMGARVSFNLPDGTVGMLNSGSQLSYSLPFDKNRLITLNGEAWFEVCHDQVHPFEITSGSSIVKVLGTKFNMSAYPNENYVEVVLEEGKVEYLNKEVSKKETISPFERLVYQDGQISRSVTDPAKYRAWTEGKLVFRGDGMAEVARRIERWYNVKIEIGDKQLEKYTFRATFQDDSLEEVLRFLSMTSPIKYQITQRIILPDGTCVKEKVIIRLKKS